MRIPRLHTMRKSLKLVAVNLKWKKIQDLPYPHDHVFSPEEVPEAIAYNLNDVEITVKLYKNQRNEIQLRNAITCQYGVDVMSEDESGIGNRLLEFFYARATGIPRWEFKKLSTVRDRIAMKDVIHDDVVFRTPKMQKFLKELRSVVIDDTLGE